MAGLAADGRDEAGTASRVQELHAAATVLQPLPPPYERDQQREHGSAAFIKDVHLPGALSWLAVGAPLKQVALHQLPESLGGDRLCQARAPHQVVEAVRAVERLTEQRHRRPGADHVQGPLDGAPAWRAPGIPVGELPLKGQDSVAARQVFAFHGSDYTLASLSRS